MEWVTIVVIVALFEYSFFAIQVGRARVKYGVKAPAVSGNEEFERYFRVQQNTAEQLLIFLPAIFLYSHLANPLYAAAAGLVFVIGRAIYYLSYVKNPASRGAGFGIGFLANVFMLIASLVLTIGQLM